MRALIEKHLDGNESAVLGVAAIALDATYTLPDGIERIRREN